MGVPPPVAAVRCCVCYRGLSGIRGFRLGEGVSVLDLTKA